MKKLYYLIILTVILGLVLTGCLLSNVGQVPTSEQSGIAYLTKGPLSNELVDLVGLWHFDGDTLDSSGNLNHGSLEGDASLTSGQFGGNALSFDGDGDYVNCGDISTKDWSGLTTEAWVYWDGGTLSGYAGVYYKGASSDIGRLLINSAGTILVQNGNSNFWSDLGVVLANEWCHIAYVYDKTAGYEYIYVNGVQKGKKGRTDDIAQNVASFWIGYGYKTMQYYAFFGLIDEVRIWDGALTAEQIEDSYDHGIVIQKGKSQDDAVLGDIIITTLEVVTATAPLTVVDTLPSELRYILGTFEVNGVPTTPTVVGQTISYFITQPCAYTITFDAQVTSAGAEDNTVTNTAMADGVSASAELTIHPYEGFEKVVVIQYEDGDLEDIVEVGELVQWDMTITVPNNFDWEITNATLSDRLGAELGMAGDEVDNDLDKLEDEGDHGDLAPKDNVIPVGAALDIVVRGKANKVQFKITDISISPFSEESFVLGIFTDKNPAGKQSYTKDGTYKLNSGAVLKFIDPGTDFQLSAHTMPITVVVE